MSEKSSRTARLITAVSAIYAGASMYQEAPRSRHNFDMSGRVYSSDEPRSETASSERLQKAEAKRLRKQQKLQRDAERASRHA